MFTVIGCLVLLLAYVGLHIFVFMEDNNLALYKHTDLARLNACLMVVDGILGAVICLASIIFNSGIIFLGIFMLLMIYPLYWSLDNGEGFIHMLVNRENIKKV